MQLRKPLTLLTLASLTLVGLEFSSVAQTDIVDSLEDTEMDPPLQPHEIEAANKAEEQAAKLRAKQNPSFQPTAAEIQAEKEAELRPQPSEEFLKAEDQRVLDEGWLSPVSP